MLNCGKLIGQLSKITRHAHVNHQYLPLKDVGFISVGSSRCSSNGKDNRPNSSSKPIGTTLKAEECVPGSRYTNAKKSLAPCDVRSSGDCPASCYEECGMPPPGENPPTSKGSGNDPNCKKPILLLNWKYLLAALILAGATMYMVGSNSKLKVEDKIPFKETIIKKKEKKKEKREKTKTPVSSSSIPQEVPYLLIGGGTAAFSAFRSIKSRDPKAKVLVVTEEEDLPYMRPPLSKELWYNNDREITAQLNFKQWNGTQRSLFYEPPEFYAKVNNLMESEKGGVAVARGWKVKKIDVVNKTAILEDDYKIKYDKCLIATGTSPKNLPLFETADETVKNKVIPFRTKKDFLELEENVNDPHVHDIVIIGGGFLGSELACSLARNLNSDTKKVYQIYKEKFIMAQILPEYLSKWATKRVIQEGVNCISNAEVTDFEMKNKQLTLFLSNGQTVNADQVIVAVGAQANTDLAISSELETNPKIGGFLVNAELEARSNLWVAGDAACFYDVRLGRRRVEHHDHAVISGRLAGENMTGANKPYLHQSMFWSDLGPEIGYEAIGVVDSSLPTVGVFAKATKEDTPLAAVTASDEVTRSASEEKATLEKSQGMIKAELLAQKTQEPVQELEKNKVCPVKKEEPLHEKQSDFGKGIIFYLRDDVVVGIVLWNIFNRMSIARQVLARETQYEELNEVAKLFTIHED